MSQWVKAAGHGGPKGARPKAQPTLETLRALRDEGLSTREIAERLSWNEESVRRRMQDLGIERLPAKARREKNSFWRGGYHVDKHGYILVSMPEHPDATAGGYVRQHRLVMERHLGRRLTRQEVVDHRNGDTSDNRIENLRLFPDNAAHLRATVSGTRNLPPAERARQREAAVLRARQRVEAILLAQENGADPSQ